MTLTAVIKLSLPNFLGRAIVIELRKAFSKFYCRHNALVEKYNVGLKHFCNRYFPVP